MASMEKTKKAGDEIRPRVRISWLIVPWIGAVVLTGAVLTLIKDFSFFRKNGSGHGHHPGAIVKKYADALEIALQLFDVQKSGTLVHNKIAWRGDSGLQDGSPINLDLTEGMYDAGDPIKLGFPTAFTATLLSWAILEYGEHITEVKQLGSAQDSLKRITDFLVNAHPSANLLYVQVGGPEVDHKCWQRPEAMPEDWPVTQINASFRRTDVAAETAAAVASASLVFKKINVSYPNLLLMHMEVLTVSAFPNCRNTKIPQDMEMNSCVQLPGFIMQLETNHTSDM